MVDGYVARRREMGESTREVRGSWLLHSGPGTGMGAGRRLRPRVEPRRAEHVAWDPLWLQHLGHSCTGAPLRSSTWRRARCSG
jgi:hypothetical protein